MTIQAATKHAIQDPLRDTTKLADAATKQAQRLLQEHKKGKGETMSAMDFCRVVLDEGFGLQDWAIGQRQRIVISKARKEALGSQDHKIIKASPGPAPVDLPTASKVFEQMSKELSAENSVDRIDTIGSALDANTLKDTGIVHIPGVLAEKQVLEILQYLSAMEEDKACYWTYLRPTTGNGNQGAYATLKNMPYCLENLQTKIRETLESKLGVESGNKAILLKYGIDGINWAHTDQSDRPYQALVLLSRPGVDYEGGKLYVCDPSSKDEKSSKHIYREADLENSGDVAVFAANENNATGQPFYHGMTRILPGSNRDEKESHCFAIGFLQM